jgi:predicted deacylase
VGVGETVIAGQDCGRIYFPDTPMRPPVMLSFPESGMVSCRRFPTLTTRGDCLFNLMVDC